MRLDERHPPAAQLVAELHPLCSVCGLPSRETDHKVRVVAPVDAGFSPGRAEYEAKQVRLMLMRAPAYADRDVYSDAWLAHEAMILTARGLHYTARQVSV